MYEKPHSIHKGDLKRGIRHVAISTAGGSNTYLFVLQEATTSCSSSPEYPTLHYSRQSIPTDFRLWSNYRWVYWPKVPAQCTYQSSSGGQPSSKASCPARGLALASQQSSRLAVQSRLTNLSIVIIGQLSGSDDHAGLSDGRWQSCLRECTNT